jgi:hypothetical protein
LLERFGLALTVFTIDPAATSQPSASGIVAHAGGARRDGGMPRVARPAPPGSGR